MFIPSLSKTDLRLPLLRTSTDQKSFAYRRAKDWSDLQCLPKVLGTLMPFLHNPHFWPQRLGV